MKNASKKKSRSLFLRVLSLTKVDFGPILKTALEEFVYKSTIRNGFKACSLCPWNPDAIDFSKCLGTTSAIRNLVLINKNLR